jgi:uroporphyrinogen decarboxylase
VNDRFLRACRGEPVDCTPIWLMRQAGRYMAAYRELRERHSFLELVESPELACEVTLQPVDTFALDAAIVFADILPLLAAMGLEVEFARGERPRIANLLRSAADVERLVVPPAEEIAPFTVAAIGLVRRALAVPLIGFSGAPFTLASYAVEGETSRDVVATKDLMQREPAVWDTLMTKLAETVGAYLLAQARAGAQALQLFDSWVGALGPEQYERHVLPYTARALAIARDAGVPLIHFGVGTSGVLELLAAAGGDVVGLDWRVSVRDARRRLNGTPVQGNLDPVALLAPWPELERQARLVLDEAGGRPGHIFNLGHGILPQTPPENVARLVDLVHAYTS